MEDNNQLDTKLEGYDWNVVTRKPARYRDLMAWWIGYAEGIGLSPSLLEWGLDRIDAKFSQHDCLPVTARDLRSIAINRLTTKG